MKFLVIQENGRHAKNMHFRECFSLQRALRKHEQECDVWGLRHPNYNNEIDFNSYDVIINLENYDQKGWVPDLGKVKAYKMLWAIDTHVRGQSIYRQEFQRGKYNLILQATRHFVDNNSEWFPNCFDDTLIGPREVSERADVGFCGNVVNRQHWLDLLNKNFKFVSDIFVIGEDMVEAINSYKVHFNKNIAGDINYRSFETIGCKVPLVTNYDKQYEDLGFEDNKNCIMYKDKRDLVDKIRNILTKDKARIDLAQEGYELSKRHTYFQRAEELLDLLKRRI